jgi:hypothetical protein
MHGPLNVKTVTCFILLIEKYYPPYYYIFFTLILLARGTTKWTEHPLNPRLLFQ